MKSSILDSITVVNESIQEQIKADKDSLQTSIKKVEVEVNTQKIKQLYIPLISKSSIYFINEFITLS